MHWLVHQWGIMMRCDCRDEQMLRISSSRSDARILGTQIERRWGGTVEPSFIIGLKQTRMRKLILFSNKTALGSNFCQPIRQIVPVIRQRLPTP